MRFIFCQIPWTQDASIWNSNIFLHVRIFYLYIYSDAFTYLCFHIHSHILHLIVYDHYITRFLLSIYPSCQIFDKRRGAWEAVYRYTVYLSLET